MQWECVLVAVTSPRTHVPVSCSDHIMPPQTITSPCMCESPSLAYLRFPIYVLFSFHTR